MNFLREQVEKEIKEAQDARDDVKAAEEKLKAAKASALKEMQEAKEAAKEVHKAVVDFEKKKKQQVSLTAAAEKARKDAEAGPGAMALKMHKTDEAKAEATGAFKAKKLAEAEAKEEQAKLLAEEVAGLEADLEEKKATSQKELLEAEIAYVEQLDMQDECKELKNAAKKEMREALEAKRKLAAAEKVYADRARRIENEIDDTGLDHVVAEPTGCGKLCQSEVIQSVSMKLTGDPLRKQGEGVCFAVGGAAPTR